MEKKIDPIHRTTVEEPSMRGSKYRIDKLTGFFPIGLLVELT